MEFALTALVLTLGVGFAALALAWLAVRKKIGRLVSERDQASRKIEQLSATLKTTSEEGERLKSKYEEATLVRASLEPAAARAVELEMLLKQSREHIEALIAERAAFEQEMNSFQRRVLGLGVDEFWRKNFSNARGHFEAYLRCTKRHELISRATSKFDGIFGEGSSDSEIKEFIERRMASYASGSIAPRFLAERATKATSELRQTKLLLCFSRYINNDSRFMQNDMIDHFYDTAKRAGLQAEVFYVDDCSYPGLATIPVERARARLQELRTCVARLRPDVIFFDGQYVGDHTTLSAEFLEDLRAEFGVQIIGVMADAWQQVSVPMANHWLPAVDALYHFGPGAPIEAQSIDAGKLVWSGFPVNSAQFYVEREKPKDIAISFAGTAHFGLRLYWLSVVATAAEVNGIRNVALQVHDRLLGDAVTMDDYAATMRRSRIVVSLPRRYNYEFGMTGRLWQALHCGALVLEEYNPLTEAYFAPYVHYVPFRSGEELERLIRFFHENQSYVDLIGNKAAELMVAEYSEQKIWTEILGKTMPRTRVL